MLPLLAAALALTGWPIATAAQTPLDNLRFSPDVTIVLDGTTVDHNEVAEDDLAGVVTLVNIGGIPLNAIVTAYDQLGGGDQLLAFDIDIVLPGGLFARSGDIVRFDGSTFTLLFSSAANGIPRGVITDAVSAIGPDDLLLSFDITVNLGSFVASDADIVRFHDSAFSLFFDGDSLGVAAGLDVDALHCIQSNGHLLLSFDGSGVLGGVPFSDEDVLEYAPGSGTFAIAYDGEDEHSGWFGSDLQAVAASTGASQTSAPTIGPPASASAGGNSVVVGSTRVSGSGTPRAKPEDTCIQIYDVGPNGRPDAPPGSVDDILLGVGGTDEAGNFVAVDGTPGIPVSPPLRNDQTIFAYDVCAEMVGGVFFVSFPAPVLSPPGLVAVVLILAAIGALALGPRRSRWTDSREPSR